MVVNNLAIYTDGACLGNPGPGGWGAVILDGQEKRVLHGHEADTTNNRMEIYAVIRGLQDVPKDVGVTLYSDSTYVINTMTKGWKRNKNQDLWDLLDEEVRGRRIVWKWVKGHSGDPLNEEADKLAHGEATGILKKDKLMESKAKKKDKFLTHIDDTGAAQMVDVGNKRETTRVAIAKGSVQVHPQTLELIIKNEFEKGDVLAVARVAGIMAAKETSRLIPLCHPLPLTKVSVDFEVDRKSSEILITGTAKIMGKTGVEMEALTAVSVSALTIYDMCKAVDRGMTFSVWLEKKSGGRSGDISFQHRN